LTVRVKTALQSSKGNGNLYREAYRAIRAERAGKRIPTCDFPTVDDGIAGMAFLETLLASHQSKANWMKTRK
jgi:hypothetical protein